DRPRHRAAGSRRWGRRRARPTGGVARPAAVRPGARDPRGRRGLLQRLRARDRRPHGPDLRLRALRPALRRVTATRRPAARHPTRHAQHGGPAPEDVRGDTGPEAGGRGRRLRADVRGVPRQLRGGGQRRSDRPRGCLRRRLSARADRHLERHSDGPRPAPAFSHRTIGMSLTPPLFLAMVLGHVVCATGALVAPTGRSARGLATSGAIAGSSAGLVVGLDALIRGTTFHHEVPQLLALAGGVSLGLDRLGAFFLVAVEIVAVPTALFGRAYSRMYEGTSALRPLGMMLNLFLLALGLVPLADNVVTFVLLWELMSVTSYFLVLTESDRRETRQAGRLDLGTGHGRGGPGLGGCL